MTTALERTPGIPLPATSVTLPGPAALRGFARAFSQFNDFDRFVAGLQSALDRAPAFGRSVITLDRHLSETNDEPSQFSPGSLSLPLAGTNRVHGVLQVQPTSNGERRTFGAGDLHLLAGLADFLAAALDQAANLRDAGRSRELLRFLLNQAPIGLAAYGPEKTLVVANELATQWLGDNGPPFLEIESGHTGFHLRAAGKLIYGEARRTPDGLWVVAMHDLTPAQARFLNNLELRALRSQANRQPASFVILESNDIRHGVLHQLETLRTALGDTGEIGPYDAHRLGLVLPGIGLAAARQRLRGFQETLAAIPDLRLGFAERGRDGDTREDLLAAALRRCTPYAEALRPAVLAHDDDPGVLSSIALVIGRDYRLVSSSEISAIREHLRREEFDLFVTEIDLRGTTDGLSLAREALAEQPNTRPLFTSVHPTAHPLPPDFAAAGATVLGKPFHPNELRAAFRNRLGT